MVLALKEKKSSELPAGGRCKKTGGLIGVI
jgi:hypothetical protein